MRVLKHLFEANSTWAQRIKTENPDFFRNLARQQTPEYLWIGCSDSRLPAYDIVGLKPGDIFVHRNVANLVIHTDFSCLTAMQFAVEVLKVKHIIVCGHYGCGGVLAAMDNRELGLLDNWLCHIKDLYADHRSQIEALSNREQQANLLCEINVRSQVEHVTHTTIVQSAWRRGQPLSVHGWIYSMEDGLLNDLGVTATEQDQVVSIYRMPHGKHP
jgi:carbonic anhydrase